jgi:exosortase A-associated hydrolase 1
MGDSPGALRDFQAVSKDVAAAMDALQARLPSVKQVALWGLCDGASAALLYCQETSDPRVAGLCLVNPWVRSETSLARTQIKHYYTRRLMQKEFWIKLVRGGVATQALAGLVRNFWAAIKDGNAPADSPTQADPSAPFQQRMAAGWANFRGPILLLLGNDDYTAREFLEYSGTTPVWQKNLLRSNVTRHDVPDVDHTFSGASSRKVAERLTLSWLTQQLAAPQSGGTGHAN